MVCRVLPDVERSVASGSITNAFAALGTQTAHQYNKWWVFNNTDAVIQLNWDGTGTNVNASIPPSTGLIQDEGTNPSSGIKTTPSIAQNTQFYIRYSGAAPTKGSVYLNGTYLY